MTLLMDADNDVGLDEFLLLSGGARDAAFMQTEREIRRLQELQYRRIHFTETTSGFLDDAFHTPASWLQAITNSARATASARVRVARLLVDMPLLAEAVREGAVGDDQLRLLRQLHDDDRCRPLLPEYDELLTEHARTLVLHDFRLVCERWKAWADPDGTDRDHALAHKNRRVKFTKTDAGFIMQAEGPAHIGEQLEQILRAHEEAEYLTDVNERAATYGAQADAYPLARTGVQRRFDALVAVCLKGAGTDRPGNVATTVNLLTTPEHLLHVMHRYFSGGGDNTVDRSRPMQRVGETANGAPVSDLHLLNAALNEQVRRVLIDSAGRVIDLGRRSRLFVGAAREAVLLLGDRCCFPGCDHCVASMHVDHLEAFAANGVTDPSNGAVTCPAHNQAKERHRISVKRDETGWHHYRADGTEIAPRDVVREPHG